jgi:putative transposase
MTMDYPYLLTDSLWNEVSKSFAGAARKRKQSLRVVLSGVLYLLKTGCQWRMLPGAYGKWQLVYYYFRRWERYGILEDLLYKLSAKVRVRQGRKSGPTAGVVDTQSVKNASGVSKETGYDGGKKVKGRKRSLATDTLGNPLAVGVSRANQHDVKAIASIREDVEDYSTIALLVADGAFKGNPPFDGKGRIKWKVVNKKGGPFKVLPKRWVVERTFAWLVNFRRLSKDYEKTVPCAKAMLLVACICITLNKLMT